MKQILLWLNVLQTHLIVICKSYYKPLLVKKQQQQFIMMWLPSHRQENRKDRQTNKIGSLKKEWVAQPILFSATFQTIQSLDPADQNRKERTDEKYRQSEPHWQALVKNFPPSVTSHGPIHKKELWNEDWRDS